MKLIIKLFSIDLLVFFIEIFEQWNYKKKCCKTGEAWNIIKNK